jgi:hypothetical protein
VTLFGHYASMSEADPADSEPERERAGVLIVRAWLDHGSSFRARVTRVDDLVEGQERVTTHADPDEVRAVLNAWLRDLDGLRGSR